jgi:phospholipase C
MTGYTPEQVPVISTIARGFATFDHWHCEVPSQTFTNRSFYHAASSSGFVVNAPYENFPLRNVAETIFERLEAAGLPWRIYVDPGYAVSRSRLSLWTIRERVRTIRGRLVSSWHGSALTRTALTT